ncbi:solute carrier family 17 member 9 isoform X2 [Mesocricetus auratus]|uniref:Solute carrier family 17 member 9 isoform X2 n=1 Tax=Mesocricetus auratus TaxID=10036 RepID=A0ABM2WD59_MESAU|nr:solute carrier family 17 member 9 isoform X2 [Mesocricetus auratus]
MPSQRPSLMQPTTEETRKTPFAAAEDTQWSRPECQAWTGMLLLGTCLLYCTRVTMPVCTLAMSQDFGWNKKEAGIVLSSFFWGYCLTQVVGGHLGDRIGGEKIILLSASTWGFITVVTPLIAHLGSGHLAFMTFSRILMGLLQGVYFPALTSLLSQRVQESERAFTYSTVGAGSQFGTLVTGGIGSVLLDWCGWQSVFYFSGGLTLLWVYYVYRCLLNEKDLFLALGVLAQGLPMARPSKVPWRQLFRKPSVWAVVFSQLSSACSFFILLSWLPTFFKETFPHSKGWIFNVVPWLLAIPASLFSGFLSDRLISQGYRVITVRKFMQSCPAGDGPRSVKHFCPVSGSHHKLPQGYDLCISFHWLPDLQPQWYFSQHSGPGPILCWFSVWCGQHCRGLGSGRHQQPGTGHLSGVRQGPAGRPGPCS